jgi:large subunit ribosomal protein L31
MGIGSPRSRIHGNYRPMPDVTQPHGTLVRAAQVPVHARVATRRPTGEDNRGMRPDIHPQYNVTTVTCSCGNSFVTRSTAKNGQIHVETCSACHPFYTGKQRVLDTAGRVAKFQQKYAKVQAKKGK